MTPHADAWVREAARSRAREIAKGFEHPRVMGQLLGVYERVVSESLVRAA